MSDQPPITDAQRRRNEETYHLALGRFVDAFARIEVLLQLVLFHYARTPMPFGPAVFSGARTAVIDGFLRRLAEVGAMDPRQWAGLEPVLQLCGGATVTTAPPLRYPLRHSSTPHLVKRYFNTMAEGENAE